MVGVTTEVTLDSVLAEDALRLLAGWDMDALAFDIGALLESSTKERIATEKVAPDGTPWAPWSSDYAATRGPQHSLLVGVGNPGLMESVQNYTTGTEITIGTNLVYGAVHQMGSAPESEQNIPARPYLGVSDEDRRDIAELITGELP